VTHHLHFAKESDHVVLMDEGRVEVQGSFAELERSNNSLLSVFKIESQKKASEEIEKRVSEHEVRKKSEKILLNKGQEKAAKEEAAQVTWTTYKRYFTVKGDTKKFIHLSLLFVSPHVITVLFTRILGVWAEDHLGFSEEGETFSHVYYVFILSLMLIFMLVADYMKITETYAFFVNSNTEVHQKMLNALLRAKTLFFDMNPSGKILNRFSNDLGVLDKGIPRNLFEFFDQTVSNMSLLVTICLINPAIAVPAVLVFIGLFYIKKFFKKPVVVTKKLDLTSKSPMISAVPATLQGLTIIRVYNQGARFIKEFADLIYVNTKAVNFLVKTTRIFIILLETPFQILTVSGVWIFIIAMLYYDFTPGLLGLSLMYLLKLGSHSAFQVGITLEIDIQMQSAQRALDYFDLPSEAPNEVPHIDTLVERSWPNKGEIVFNKVFMKYRDDLGFALKGLSLRVPGGMKVACIGRTGAGKSSIIQAMFRMTEIEKGGDIKIDDVDIRNIGLSLLRSRLSIIPQTPVIFTGTIKRNLDPFETLSDYELWKVLEDVGLKQHVAALEHQLETDMTVSSSVFSTGQKQLMCLARAILSRSNIIILDEATANVDVETDNLIQKTIMEKFKDCTVLTVAHRLITIANYDRVVVIDDGNVAEYDTPYALLVENLGDREITRKNSLFADMVKSTGASMAKKIFDVTKEQYFLVKKKKSQ